MARATRRRSRLAAWLAPLLLGVASVAAAWPLESLPEPRASLLDPGAGGVVSHGEWALQLAEALGVAGALPQLPGEEAVFALLCPEGPSGALVAGGARIRVPTPERMPADGALRLAADLPQAALWALVVSASGAGSWSVDGEAVGVLDPGGVGEATAPTRLPLGPGAHEIAVRGAPGIRIDRVELSASGVRCVAPAAGWRSGAGLTFGDKARTLVQALGLEGRLAPDGEPRLVEGEDFDERHSPGAARTNRDTGLPASGGAWAMALGGATTFDYPVRVREDRVVTVLARVHGLVPQRWSLDDVGMARLRPGTEARRFAWTEVATLRLAAGDHRIRAVVPEGAGIDALQLVPRRAGDADYLRVLQDLGLQEGGPSEPVSRAAAQRNLASDPVRRLAAHFLRGSGDDEGGRLALVEGELERLYGRPLSPILPGEM